MGTKLSKMIRVVDKDGNEGTVITADAKSKIAVVQWDTGETRPVSYWEVVPKGRGRRPGEGRKVSKDPSRTVSLDRHIDAVIRKEMERLNLSQRELALKVQMSRRTIQRILATNGHKQRIETLEAIAEALGISPARFWTVESKAA